MTRKRCFSARIWCSHMRLPQAKPCSSTTGGPSPASVTEMFRSPTWILSITMSRSAGMSERVRSFPRKRQSDKKFRNDRGSPGSPHGRVLRGDCAEKGRDLGAQLLSRLFDLLGRREHGLRRTARLGDAVRHLVERLNDRLGARRSAGDVVRNFAGGGFLLFHRPRDLGGVIVDILHALGDGANRRDGVAGRALHRKNFA